MKIDELKDEHKQPLPLFEQEKPQGLFDEH